MRKQNIVVIGILNTKGEEIRYIADQIEKNGANAQVMEISLGEECGWADIGLSQLLECYGKSTKELFAMGRAEAAETVSQGGIHMMKKRQEEGLVQGVIAIGGSMGTTIACNIMRSLPVGVPKMMLSSDASGEISQYIGTKDICMLYPIAEAGLNKITKRIFSYAAAGIVGMANAAIPDPAKDKPLVGCMMFGVTTPCVLESSAKMEEAGYDVLINHCTGAGGRSMEEMLQEGQLVGLLDITTQELVADMFHTPSQQAGPMRLRSAARLGIPQVVVPGGCDLILFDGEHRIPENYRKEVERKERGLYVHNPSVANVGLKPEEAVELGKMMADRLNEATAPVVICVPMRGWGSTDIGYADLKLGWAGPGASSMWISDPEHPGQSLRSKRFAEGLKEKLEEKENMEILLVDKHINEPEFGELAAGLLLEMLDGTWKKGSHTELSYVQSM